MKYLLPLLLFCTTAAIAKDASIEVVAVHQVMRNDQGSRARMDKFMLGRNSIDRQVEIYNIDAIIDGEHVILSCMDDKGCESPAKGTYQAEVKRGKFVHMAFPVPLAEKPVKRWYKIAGSW